MDDAIDRTLRQTWAFVFRGYHLTRRYISWVIVFNFYALTGSVAVALIGVAGHDHRLTLTLVVGALLWNFLSTLYNEIAMSVAYERWEGTLEYTFMAPVPPVRASGRPQRVRALQQHRDHHQRLARPHA